jgi:hypothetical protein
MLKDDQFEEPKGFISSVLSKWTQIFIMI